jgi:cadmium resistance protein CadD (predicted permease)
MRSLFDTVRAAAGIFAGTSVEDLVVLTALFLSSRAVGQPRLWQIWAGWYTGIAILVVISGAGALGLVLVPGNWVGLLGIAPLSVGVYKLIETIRARGRGVVIRPVMAAGVMSVAGLAISNGGDNIAVYVPVFRAVGLWESMVMVAVFAAGVTVWCLAASLLGSHKKIVEMIELYGHWIVPAVYIIVGVAIIVNSGIVRRLG